MKRKQMLSLASKLAEASRQNIEEAASSSRTARPAHTVRCTLFAACVRRFGN